MIQKIIYIASFIFFVVACTTTQHVTFNKDWSGKVTTTVDMTTLNSMYGESTDESENAQTIKVFEDTANIQRIELLKKIDGIYDVQIEKNEKNVSVLSYKFKHIDALNASALLMTEGMTVDPNAKVFTLKNKKEILVNLPALKNESGEDASVMGAQFLYNMELTFARKVKSIETTNDSIVKNGNNIRIASDLGKLMDGKISHQVVIKVK